MESCDEVCFPLLRQQRTVRRQLKWVIEPLFPMYLFARFSMTEQLQKVRYTSGVIGVVGTSNGGPIVVDESIIVLLREREVDGYVQIQPAPLLPGEDLEIIAGPFQGLRALFERELRGGERVAVLLDLLSSRVHVELPRASLQRRPMAEHRLSAA